MSTMDLRLEGNVHILTLTNSENDNTFTLDVLNEYLAALDEVESYKGNTALVVTCEHEKTWSNGINLPWMTSQSADDVKIFVNTLEEVFYRVAMLNAPTIACINGNCYAGGAILASAFDFKIMRSDRGRFCYPEVNIKIPFTELMIDIIDLIPNKHALKHLALTGIAKTGAECLEDQIVDALYPMNELQAATLAYATELATKDRGTYTTIKRSMRKNIARHRQ
ncbi:hypothetical protein A9Q99_26445 [Gammaproteobacteria bacterium 45_16_T64]|nr:hypothetical protein A9Q99_26445 [Gammaproteobacteria bacterium 45_16_T64]